MRFLICNHVRKLALSRHVAKKGAFPQDAQTHFSKTEPKMKNWFGSSNRNQDRVQTKAWQSTFATFKDELGQEMEEDKQQQEREKITTDSWIHHMSAEERMIQLERQFSSDDDFIEYLNPDDKAVDGYFLPTFAGEKGYLKNDRGRTVIYTSGSSIANDFNGKLYLSSGCGVYFGPGKGLKFPNPTFYNKHRNQWDRDSAELFAIDFAMKEALKLNQSFIEIRTSSQFVITEIEKIPRYMAQAERYGEKTWYPLSDGRKFKDKVKHQGVLKRIEDHRNGKNRRKEVINVKFVHIDEITDDIGITGAVKLADGGADIHWNDYYDEWLRPDWKKNMNLLR